MNVSNIAFPSPIQLRDLCERVFRNQDNLNVKAYDTAWVNKAISGEFDYPLAAGFEIVEFGNSWNKWNWWTKKEPGEFEKLNMKIELIDALHFIASDVIVAYDKNFQSIEIDSARSLDWVQGTLPILEEPEVTPYVKDRIKGLLAYSSGVKAMPSHKDNSIHALCELYRLAIFGCGMSFRDMATLYLAKSVLNQFRQDNGYREKKYTKVWVRHPKFGDVEDNHVMANWVGGQDKHPTPEAIREFLTTEYAKVQAAQSNQTN